MAAYWTVGIACRAGDIAARAVVHNEVDEAKQALGERGPVWGGWRIRLQSAFSTRLAQCRLVRMWANAALRGFATRKQADRPDRGSLRNKARVIKREPEVMSKYLFRK